MELIPIGQFARLTGLTVRAVRHYGDLRTLMDQDWGRRLAYWLIFELGGLHGDAFAADKRDATEQHTAYRLGRQSLAREFDKAAKEVAPHDYLAMMAEQIRERQADLALEESSEHEREPDE